MELFVLRIFLIVFTITVGSADASKNITDIRSLYEMQVKTPLLYTLA